MTTTAKPTPARRPRAKAVPKPRPALTEPADPPTEPVSRRACWPIPIGDTLFHRSDADAFGSPIGAELAWECAHGPVA